ncbi:MAG: TonB-dependent receptor [Gammaproteobacteria bacterium]|nr:TonB-dependent receptor [Gammaproteobacteria bacterium]
MAQTARWVSVVLGLVISNSAASSPLQIPEIVVTAPAASKPPFHTHTISEKEIQLLKPKNISELLRNRGGVQVSDLFGDGASTTVSVRGFGSNAHSNSLVLVDGFKLNGIDIASPDLTSVLMEDIQNIEIFPGSASVLYGDQAVGGVVNIKRKIPEHMAWRLSGERGTFDQKLYQGSFENTLTQNFATRVSAQHKTSRNFRQNNALELSHFLARANYSLPLGRLLLDYAVSDKDLQLPGALSKAEVKHKRRLRSTPNDFTDTETHDGRLGLFLPLTPQWFFEGKFAFRQNKTEGALQNTHFEQARSLLGFYPRITTTFPAKKEVHELAFGVDLEANDYAMRAPGARTRGEQQTWAAYSQLTYSILPSVKTLIGGRYTIVNTELLDSFFSPKGSSFKTQIGVTSLSFQGEHFQSFNWFIKREDNFRFPKVDEQTFTNGTRLKTQRGVSYEGGLGWRSPFHSLKLTGYYLKLQNEIDFDPTQVPFGANRNLDPTARKGLLLEGDTGLSAKSRLSAQYTWTDARFKKGHFARNRIPFVAEHTLRCALSYSILPSLSFILESQTTSDRYAINDVSNTAGIIGGYTVENSSLNYTHKGLNVGLRINNLSNKSYSDTVAVQWDNRLGFYPSPPRSILLTISYDK